MNNIEQLYYALGELCYAIARSAGPLSDKEEAKLHEILQSEFKQKEELTDPAEIIFHILSKEGMDSKTAYGWGIHEMQLNSQYLSENLKGHFAIVIQKVVNAFPSITDEEQELINDFIRQMNNINGDPVFSHLTE